MKNEKADQFAAMMKHDWDERARQDAKWFINTLRRQQSEDEFDQTGMVEIERLVLADLALLTGGRDPRTLRLLEIGCGAGRMTRHLAGVFGEVVGIDVSGEMVRQAKERLASKQNVKLYETNGVDFSIFPDEYFDLIFSAYVYQHVPSAEVIASNIRDAWRILAPGGLFKFQTSGIASADFEQIEKNTWSGAPFPEEKVRQLAHQLGAQLIAIFGAETQYCWTILRKRTDRGPIAQKPRIEYYGRTVDARNKQIPTGGDEASLTVIVSGLDHDCVDCNSVLIEINGRSIPARYVGPIGRNFEPALQADLGRSGFAGSTAPWTQIEIGVPTGVEAGAGKVKVVVSERAASDVATIELVEPSSPQPKIGSIMNVYDDGLELDASGPRSRMRILVEGLDPTASIENVRVQIGETLIVPVQVGFLPGNAVHEVEAQLPEGTIPGPTSARVHFGERQSPPVALEIK